MSTQDVANPTAKDAEQRVERAKASLLSRLELLKQKVTGAKQKVDLRAQITAHPLPAVGIAFGLGVLAALQRTRAASPAGTSSRPIANAAVAGLAAVGLRLLRELVLSQLGNVAKEWWSEIDGAAPREARGSHMTDVEPFLEH